MKLPGVSGVYDYTQDRIGTCDIAPRPCCCFRQCKSVSVPIASCLPELNTQPTCTPVYASPNTSRCATQNSGPSGSLLLSRRTLSFPASCRFIPAHCDVDFEDLELRVTRSIWHQVLGNCKTEASAKPVPMDSYMAEDLLRWRRQSVYASDDDYVFASETMRGKQPYWPDNLMKRHIQPVAKAIGIHKKIGWHTFRHSFGTLLKANGEDVKTVQELLRHANSRITLDVYTQAVNSNKRAAQSKVVRMMVSDMGQKVEEKYPQTQQ